MKRIESIDTTRGLVMVIMALDHVRDFMHKTSMSQDPTNLQTTTTLLFLTRWITHLCAPTFVFLSGISAFISFKRQNNLSESRRFLLTRGIWLVILEFTFVNFALWFDIHFSLFLMEVIAAIGLSFIVLSFLLKLPSRVIGISGILIIFGHNLLQGVSIPENPMAVLFSSVLFRPNLMHVSHGFTFFTAYPLVPWLGILLAGFACGELFELSPELRKKMFLKIGIGVLLLFLLIRFINIYGDPSKWAVQKSTLFSFLSFFNLTKYPPSLLFSLLFIGITLIVLYLSERKKFRFTEILSVYGRVPLFYFVLHLFIIHSLMFIMLYIQGFSSKEFIFGAFKNGRPASGGGVELYVIYLIWIGVVALLYPVCKWYGNYKSEHRENKFLRYL
ncbi:MAG: DUF1624 domain-containing protein [Bacteroidetes bacterium]|nr:MAG: DUF1624 domain-containing protein [Bacteroidota bacterium]